MWPAAPGSAGAPPPQYEPIVTAGNEALVHHMEVFQCAAEFESFPAFSGPCDSKMKPERLNYCRHVLAAWALGAKVRACPTSAPEPPRRGYPRELMRPPGWPRIIPPTACTSCNPKHLLSHQGFLQPPLCSPKNAKAPQANITCGHPLCFPDQGLLDLGGLCPGWSRGWPPRAASRVFQQLRGGAWGVGSPLQCLTLIGTLLGWG